ncbi:hypothetical protein BDN70DRAFT_820325 [Pholiota conissans]|uniref:Uncharacterized protein n=1 Tax=Pholiota conissans TaxID=109636 RepID=A0A9P6CLZ9_9AGAR|nr:hypothetical protein BDN70DRAFT_820325 [Pholiota conissans]
MQLQTILLGWHCCNGLIYTGMESGKTLPMAILILLDNSLDGLITITVSPLKRLQASQLLEFISHYGIITIANNNNMPYNNAWWAVSLYNV